MRQGTIIIYDETTDPLPMSERTDPKTKWPSILFQPAKATIINIRDKSGKKYG